MRCPKLVLLLCLVLSGFRAPTVHADSPPEPPPNFVFILADDLGWTDLACQGSKYYETPNIDRMAAEGMRFTSFYVCQNCAPSRASYMSGQYGTRTGIYTVNSLERGDEADRKMVPPVNKTELGLEKRTIAQELKRAGYATAIFGKWHLGDEGEHHPARRGFDEAAITSGKHFGFETNPPTHPPAGTYLADWLTDLSLKFIEKSKDRPFFLYVPHFGVHAPHEAKPELIEHFKKKAPAGGHYDPVYAAMIASVDESVGRILAKLKELGLDERTLVIFASDNGGVGGYDRVEGPGKRKQPTTNEPLRGGKGTLYEGGLRVPFIARWPYVIKPGTTNDSPAAHVDLMPTLLELAGVKKPEGYPLDGHHLQPLLFGETCNIIPIFWHFPGYLESYANERGWRTTPASVIRLGDYKMQEFLEDGRVELYDLAHDIGEKENLAAKMPEKVADLRGRLHRWREETGAAMPVMK